MTEPAKYPGPCVRICKGCPWARTSVPGWLGPLSPAAWIEVAHSDEPVACHETIHEVDEMTRVGTWSSPVIRQCRGIGQFRTNRFKNPRDPDVWTADEADSTKVFGSDAEFLEHHQTNYDEFFGARS